MGLVFAGPVGLKFTGPSAKLLITLIIFIFFRSYPQGVKFLFSLRENPLQNSQNVIFAFFLFPSNLVCIYPLMPPGTCIFLFGQAGFSFTVLISLSWSDDCFPPKYSELHFFPFWHTLDHVILDPQNEILKTLPSFSYTAFFCKHWQFFVCCKAFSTFMVWYRM